MTTRSTRVPTGLRPLWVLLALALLRPLPARADLDEPRTRIQAGLEFHAALVGPQNFAGFAGAFAGYQVHRYFVVGLEGGHSFAGTSFWRAGVMAEAMPGADFLRPYARISVEALGLGNSVSPALGLQFGVAIFPIESLIIVPTVGFDGNLRPGCPPSTTTTACTRNSYSVGTLGASIRYRF
jgi:hypothetical protein